MTDMVLKNFNMTMSDPEKAEKLQYREWRKKQGSTSEVDVLKALGG